MFHNPIHSRLNASVIAEVNSLDAGRARKAHVNELTNDGFIHDNGYLTGKCTAKMNQNITYAGEFETMIK